MATQLEVSSFSACLFLPLRTKLEHFDHHLVRRQPALMRNLFYFFQPAFGMKIPASRGHDIPLRIKLIISGNGQFKRRDSSSRVKGNNQGSRDRESAG